MTAGPSRPVLYVIGCAAPPVLSITTLIKAAQARCWDTCLVLTPSAARWLEPRMLALTGLTGHPVRSQYLLPGEPGQLPRADAMLVAPATGNTINKLAAGISDTLALGLVNEAIAGRLPTVMLASLGHDQAHPAFSRSAATLRAAGVTLLLPDRPAPGRPDTGDDAGFPWQRGLAALPDPHRGVQDPDGRPPDPHRGQPDPQSGKPDARSAMARSQAAQPPSDGWRLVLEGLRGGGGA